MDVEGPPRLPPLLQATRLALHYPPSYPLVYTPLTAWTPSAPTSSRIPPSPNPPAYPPPTPPPPPSFIPPSRHGPHPPRPHPEPRRPQALPLPAPTRSLQKKRPPHHLL